MNATSATGAAPAPQRPRDGSERRAEGGGEDLFAAMLQGHLSNLASPAPPPEEPHEPAQTSPARIEAPAKIAPEETGPPNAVAAAAASSDDSTGEAQAAAPGEAAVDEQPSTATVSQVLAPAMPEEIWPAQAGAPVAEEAAPQIASAMPTPCHTARHDIPRDDTASHAMVLAEVDLAAVPPVGTIPAPAEGNAHATAPATASEPEALAGDSSEGTPVAVPGSPGQTTVPSPGVVASRDQVAATGEGDAASTDAEKPQKPRDERDSREKPAPRAVADPPGLARVAARQPAGADSAAPPPRTAEAAATGFESALPVAASAPAPDVAATASSSTTGRGLPLPLSPAESQRLAVELVRAARDYAATGRGELTFSIRPPHLGTLRMRLAVAGDAARIDVIAQTREALHLFRAHAAELSSQLREQGMNLTGLHLTLAGDGGSARGQEDGNRHATPGGVPPRNVPAGSARAPAAPVSTARSHSAGALDLWA